MSYLQSCVEFLNLAIAGNDAGKLVEALEELENQVPCRFSSSHANPPCPALLWCAPGCFFWRWLVLARLLFWRWLLSRTVDCCALCRRCHLTPA